MNHEVFIAGKTVPIADQQKVWLIRDGEIAQVVPQRTEQPRTTEREDGKS